MKEADELFLATDEDREGEAISWHLRELLQPKVPVHRLVFHEITDEAIHEALEHPRDIDDDLVNARNCGGSSTGCMAMKSRRCYGARSGPAFRPAVCRAWPCG